MQGFVLDNFAMDNIKLLKDLCAIHAPSGEEFAMRDFLLAYIEKESGKWACAPTLHYGDGFQDCLVLVFGKPRVAVYAHMDSVGFTSRYNNELVKIGGPRTKNGIKLVGKDSKGSIDAVLRIDDEAGTLYADTHRLIEPGTSLVFKQHFLENYDTVQSCFLDNRLGIWMCLNLATTLKNGVIAFSCWEEHGGGSAESLARYLYETFSITQSLIADITWVTEGVVAGGGCAVSLRDSGIPRRKYVERILAIARKHEVAVQTEIESSGGSDGNAIQKIPYPIDWCFVGAPETNVHSPEECVNKNDAKSMLELYKILMEEL